MKLFGHVATQPLTDTSTNKLWSFMVAMLFKISVDRFLDLNDCQPQLKHGANVCKLLMVRSVCLLLSLFPSVPKTSA